MIGISTGTGFVLPHLSGEFKHSKGHAVLSVASLQVFAEQEADCESVINAMQSHTRFMKISHLRMFCWWMFQIRSVQTAKILLYIKFGFPSIIGLLNFGDEEIKPVEGTTQGDDSIGVEICATVIIKLIFVLIVVVSQANKSTKTAAYAQVKSFIYVTGQHFLLANTSKIRLGPAIKIRLIWNTNIFRSRRKGIPLFDHIK